MSCNVVELAPRLICISRLILAALRACRTTGSNYGTIMAVWESIIQLRRFVEAAGLGAVQLGRCHARPAGSVRFLHRTGNYSG